MTRREQIQRILDCFARYNLTGVEGFLRQATSLMAAWGITSDELEG